MINNSIVVNRPIDVVFEYASHFERHPEWQDDLLTSTFDAVPALDARGSDTGQMGRRTFTYDWRVSEFDAPRRIGFETLTGPMRPAGTMTFSAGGEATRVEFAMAMNPRGFMKLMGPMIERQVQRTNTGHLAKFKQLLESNAT